MSEIWDAIAKHTGASMVAGELVGYVDGKHVSYGRKNGDQFAFTSAGLELHEQLKSKAIVEAAKAEAGGKRGRKGKAEKVEPEQIDIEDVIDAAEAAGNDGDLDRELELALADEAGTEESAG